MKKNKELLCCKEFKKWEDLRWITLNREGRWEIILSDSGSCSYDMPITNCPFCGLYLYPNKEHRELRKWLRRKSPLWNAVKTK